MFTPTQGLNMVQFYVKKIVREEYYDQILNNVGAWCREVSYIGKKIHY